MFRSTLSISPPLPFHKNLWKIRLLRWYVRWTFFQAGMSVILERHSILLMLVFLTYLSTKTVKTFCFCSLYLPGFSYYVLHAWVFCYNCAFQFTPWLLSKKILAIVHDGMVIVLKSSRINFMCPHLIQIMLHVRRGDILLNNSYIVITIRATLFVMQSWWKREFRKTITRLF